MDHATLRIDPDDPSPGELKGYFSELFDELKNSPRDILVRVITQNDRHAASSIDFEDGEPVFMIKGRQAAKANLNGRYIPEHPVPLKLSKSEGGTRLVLSATKDGRVKVRKAKLWERIFL